MLNTGIRSLYMNFVFEVYIRLRIVNVCFEVLISIHILRLINLESKPDALLTSLYMLCCGSVCVVQILMLGGHNCALFIPASGRVVPQQ